MAIGGMVVGGAKDISMVAEADLSKYQYVKKGTAQNGALVGTAGAIGRGFIDQDYDSGENIKVQRDGTCRGIAHDGAVTIDSWLTPAANGRLDSTTTNKAIIVARAIEASSAAGDVIAIEIVGPFALSA